MATLTAPIAETRPETTELWYTRCGVPTSFGVAIGRGLYRDEFRDGTVSLRAIQESADPAVHQSHFTHSQPNSFRHGSNYPAIWAQANGADTKILGITFLRGAQTILALPDSGIRTPADLKGRRILLTRRPHEPLDHSWANNLRFFEIALKSAGLTFDDVEMVEHVIERSFIEDRRTPEIESGALKTGAAFAAGKERPSSAHNQGLWALLGGEVDAIASGGSIGAGPEQLRQLLGLHVVFDLNSLEDEIERSNLSTPLVFAVKGDLLRERPDLVERVLYRAVQAEAEAFENPEEALRYVAREQFASEHAAKQAYGPDLSRIFNIDFDPLKIEALKSQVAFLNRIGVIDRPIDVDGWLAREPLAAARERYAARRRAGDA